MEATVGYTFLATPVRIETSSLKHVVYILLCLPARLVHLHDLCRYLQLTVRLWSCEATKALINRFLRKVQATWWRAGMTLVINMGRLGKAWRLSSRIHQGPRCPHRCGYWSKSFLVVRWYWFKKHFRFNHHHWRWPATLDGRLTAAIWLFRCRGGLKSLSIPEQHC